MTPRELNLGWFTQVTNSWFDLGYVDPDGFEPSFREVFLHPAEVTEVEEKTRLDYLEID